MVSPKMSTSNIESMHAELSRSESLLMFSLETDWSRYKKVTKVKLYGWAAQPRSPILWRVIRTFSVDLCLFCSHSTTAAAAIVTGAFPLDWSRFSLVDWERQWHAPTHNECTGDVSAWRLSPRFLPRFLNQYLSGRWAPRSPPHISGEQEALWPVVLVLKEGIRRSRAQTLNQWPYPNFPLRMRRKRNFYQEIIFVHELLTRWPLFSFYLPSSSELQIMYSQAQVFSVFNSLYFAFFLVFLKPCFLIFRPHSRDGLWHWRTQGTDVSGALHTGSILALKTARRRNKSEPKARLWVHEIPQRLSLCFDWSMV